MYDVVRHRFSRKLLVLLRCRAFRVNPSATSASSLHDREVSLQQQLHVKSILACFYFAKIKSEIPINRVEMILLSAIEQEEWISGLTAKEREQ